MSIIKITPTKSKLEKNLESINQPLITVENHAKAIAMNLNDAMNIFWNLPDEELLEIMNFKGPIEMEEIFNAHAQSAIAINNLLNMRGIDSICIIGMQKPVRFNADTGLFEMDYPIIEDVAP